MEQNQVSLWLPWQVIRLEAIKQLKLVSILKKNSLQHYAANLQIHSLEGKSKGFWPPKHSRSIKLHAFFRFYLDEYVFYLL